MCMSAFIRLQSIRYSCWSKILVNSTISYGGRVRLGLESPSTDPDVLLGGSLLEPRRWAGSVRRYAISAKVWTNCGGALGYCCLDSIDKLWGWIWASWRLIAVIMRAATDVYVKSTSEYLWLQLHLRGSLLLVLRCHFIWGFGLHILQSVTNLHLADAIWSR